MATDDLTPPGDAGLDDTLAAVSEERAQPETSPERSPSQQKLHEEVRGRLFEGREPRHSLEPGTTIAGRYRIVELLGAGGMGEVFRARDLVLGEDVAVKFLPEDRATDEGFMGRFVNEVRLARQISHPSVCRVHDIGEVDGRAFLSMEYIDGEDLASLLRRIGRLPPEKAYELAQQLCAGLSELHEAGLLHRDLKPANLMIDGQGRLKLADFGLAAVRGELNAHEFGDGTPAYMAPEQLDGREVSERSDIYALGVVLYELLSGRHPFEAREGTLSGERGSIDRTAPAVALSARVTGLAEDTLEIIDRCLETSPRMRPASVLDVAAALPGGDPIAAALRAGRAPSVDALANVESGTQLKPWAAWTLAGFSLLVVLVFAVLSPAHTLWGAASPKLAPAVLEDRARATVEQLGLEHPGGGSMHRLLYEDSYLQAPPPRVHPGDAGPVPVLFEYRASPRSLARRGAAATHDDPAMTTPGEVRVTLDVRGYLRAFERVADGPAEGDASAANWAAAFELAGLSEVEPVVPEGMPSGVHDRREAWTARPVGFENRVRVDAGSWRGHPVWFEVSAPWAVERAAPMPSGEVSSGVARALLSLFILGVVLLARRLYRRGEVDSRGAVRVATVLAVSVTISTLLTSVVGKSSGVETFGGALQEGLLVGGFGLLGYAVVEPYGRRFLPAAMVSWVRVTRGRWRDPLVGRDLLLGMAFGALIGVAVLVRMLWVGDGPAALPVRLDALLGLGPAAGLGLGAVWGGAFGVMQVYVMFLFLRWAVRRTSVAVGLFFLLWTAVELLRFTRPDLSPTDWAVGIVGGILVAAILGILIVRVGLLALTAAQVLLNVLVSFPLSVELSGWYGTATGVATALVLALLAGSLYVALGRAHASDRVSRTSRTRA